MVAPRGLVVGMVVLHELRCVIRERVGHTAGKGVRAAPVIFRPLRIQLFAQFIAGILVHGVEISAFIRVSIAAALTAMPPHPQMPRIPIRSASALSQVERKSTAAQKSSVFMSGEAT